jgi:hypothetical protein
MPPFLPPEKAHPEGESKTPDHKATPSDAAEVLIVDTPGGRFRAQFTPELPVSPLGALVFFTQYLCATGGFEALVADTPLCYSSNRAHRPRDVIGTLILGMLSGHYRYAHLAALRGDDIAPSLLGLKGGRQRGLCTPGAGSHRCRAGAGLVAASPRPNLSWVFG